MSGSTTYSVSPGDDLYRIAAQLYGDAMGATLIMSANSLWDPIIQENAVLIIPVYNESRANDGILASQ